MARDTDQLEAGLAGGRRSPGVKPCGVIADRRGRGVGDVLLLERDRSAPPLIRRLRRCWYGAKRAGEMVRRIVQVSCDASVEMAIDLRAHGVESTGVGRVVSPESLARSPSSTVATWAARLSRRADRSPIFSRRALIWLRVDGPRRLPPTAVEPDREATRRSSPRASWGWPGHSGPTDQSYRISLRT